MSPNSPPRKYELHESPFFPNSRSGPHGVRPSEKSNLSEEKTVWSPIFLHLVRPERADCKRVLKFGHRITRAFDDCQSSIALLDMPTAPCQIGKRWGFKAQSESARRLAQSKTSRTTDTPPPFASLAAIRSGYEGQRLCKNAAAIFSPNATTPAVSRTSRFSCFGRSNALM